jgi:hypothetical protein
VVGHKRDIVYGLERVVGGQGGPGKSVCRSPDSQYQLRPDVHR